MNEIMMDNIFVECFKELEDPRVDRTKKHLLPDVIAVAICAVICGAENWEEIEDFGNAQLTICANCIPTALAECR